MVRSTPVMHICRSMHSQTVLLSAVLQRWELSCNIDKDIKGVLPSWKPVLWRWWYCVGVEVWRKPNLTDVAWGKGSKKCLVLDWSVAQHLESSFAFYLGCRRQKQRFWRLVWA